MLLCFCLPPEALSPDWRHTFLTILEATAKIMMANYFIAVFFSAVFFLEVMLADGLGVKFFVKPEYGMYMIMLGTVIFYSKLILFCVDSLFFVQLFVCFVVFMYVFIYSIFFTYC
jgi:hypothetical protein